MDTTQYMATTNTPGYLPEDDDPPVFDTAAEAWAYLANAREGHEDDMSSDPEYSATVLALRAAPNGLDAAVADGTGVIYGPTPGYDGDHDLGLAYCVTAV